MLGTTFEQEEVGYTSLCDKTGPEEAPGRNPKKLDVGKRVLMLQGIMCKSYYAPF